MPRLAAALCLFSLVLAAGCGSDDGGGNGGGGGGYRQPKPATTAAPSSAAASGLASCLEKAGLKVTGGAGKLTATGNGDTVHISLFTSARDADAFARKQTADATQAGNRVAVYGPDPKPKTVDAIETCLPES